MARGGLLLSAVFCALMTYWPAPGSAVKVAGAVGAATEQLQVDNLLDNIMLTVHRQMATRGVDVQMLGDVSVQNRGLTLTGTDGILKGVTSIYRSDSAFVEYGNGSVILTSTFSLQTLMLSYRVNAKYLFASLTNNVSAAITQNSVKVRAGIFYRGDECYVGLQDISVDTLNGVQWSVSGFGAINALVSATINLLVPPATIQASLNDALQQGVSGYKAQCQAFIPGVGGGMNWGC